MKIEGWSVIDEEAGVLVREYAFNKNATATALVFRGKDGLVVVSPPTGLEARDYDALAELGPVRALVANNTFHNLGQRPWRARFPDAVSYCPPAAVKALDKKVPGAGFQPLDALALPDNVKWDDPPGFKTGEAILRIGTKKGLVWFTGDLLTNIPKLGGPPFSWLLSWTDSAPGFRLFKPAVWIAVKDKKAIRAWTLDRLAAEPPAIVVTSHGPPAEMPDIAALAKAQIERL
ncbi:MAG: hypothetical protein U0359_22295 [Byssovorax sp.]